MKHRAEQSVKICAIAYKEVRFSARHQHVCQAQTCQCIASESVTPPALAVILSSNANSAAGLSDLVLFMDNLDAQPTGSTRFD